MFTLSIFIVTYLTYFIQARGLDNDFKCQCSAVTFTKDVPTASFKSNGFPKEYCNHQDCDFEIEAKEGTYIIVHVEHFELEPTHDYVEVYQTQFTNGQHIEIKIEILSGTSPIHTIVSANGGGLRLHFHTDSTESDYAGFRMLYNRAPIPNQTDVYFRGCPLPFINVTSEQVTPLSMHLSHLRVSDYACSFQLNSTSAIELSVTSLPSNVEMKVWETESFQSTNPEKSKMATITHHKVEQGLYTNLRSRTNSVTIRFYFRIAALTNTTMPMLITYKKIVNPCQCFPDVFEMNLNQEVSYTSPGWPDNYCNELNCKTNLKIKNVDPNEWQFKIKIHKFGMEKDVDYLNINNGEYRIIQLSSEEVEETAEEENLAFFILQSTEPNLYFRSDHSITKAGFNITLIAQKIEDKCRCPTGPSRKQLEFKEASSLNFNFSFPNSCQNIDCFVNISKFDTELAHHFHFVLKENMSPMEHVIVTKGEIAKNNEGKIRFGHADNTITQDEFEITDPPYTMIWYHRAEAKLDIYNETKIEINYFPVLHCDCINNTFHATEGVWNKLTSPDYPQSYCNDLDCLYHITSDEGYNVVVNVTEVKTEARHDVLAIFNGPFNNGTHIGMFYGITYPSGMIQSSAISLFVTLEGSADTDGTDFVFSFTSNFAYSFAGNTSVIVIPTKRDAHCTFKYTQKSNSKVTSIQMTALYGKTNEFFFDSREIVMNTDVFRDPFSDTAVSDFRIFAACNQEVKLIGKFFDQYSSSADIFLIQSTKNAGNKFNFGVPPQFSSSKGFISILPVQQYQTISIDVSSYINGTFFAKKTLNYDASIGKNQHYLSISPNTEETDFDVTIVVSASAPIFLSYVTPWVTSSNFFDDSCGKSCYMNYVQLTPMPVVTKQCNVQLFPAEQRIITDDYTSKLYVSPPNVEGVCYENFALILYNKNNLNGEYKPIESFETNTISLETTSEIGSLSKAGQMPMYRFGSIMQKPDMVTSVGHFAHYVPSIQEWVTGETHFYTLENNCVIEFYADAIGSIPTFIELDKKPLSTYDYERKNMHYFANTYSRFSVKISGEGLHTFENNGNYVLYVVCDKLFWKYGAVGYVGGFNKRK
uniref:CUB domain-containing protein n=1 Tax=Rhabditophanes sp. KR3021 TaxID=114890 RepID=A0AC35TWB8_9BILA